MNSEFVERVTPLLWYLLKSCDDIPTEIKRELINECWLKFFSHPEKIHYPKSFVKKILLHLVIDYQRKCKEKSFSEIEETNSQIESYEDYLNSRFDRDGHWHHDSEQERKIHIKNLRSFLKKCLKGLSTTQRFIFLSREVQDSSYRELSQGLNLSEDVLRKQFSRSKNKLRDCLNAQEL